MKRLLDANVLIRHLRQRYSRPRKKHQPKDARRWANELIRLHQTNAILTPIYLEVICGTTSRRELVLTREFLDRFRKIDQGSILPQDWSNAIRIAERVFRDVDRSVERRGFADCLIRAIADRLGYEVLTADKGLEFT